VRSATDTFDLPQSKAEAIDSLLGQRLAAKKARAFEKADALQAELRGIGVEVDDKSREWHVRPALLDGDDAVDY
jgi:cysteinyl-tRNA synthetase